MMGFSISDILKSWNQIRCKGRWIEKENVSMRLESIRECERERRRRRRRRRWRRSVRR